MLNQEPRVAQGLKQKISFSPALQKRLHILQLPAHMLQDYIREAALENPLLEISARPISDETSPLEEGDSYPEVYAPSPASAFDKKTVSLIDYLPHTPSVYEDLLAQIRELFPEKQDRRIAAYLLENLEPNGYLLLTEEQIAKECHVSCKKSIAILKQLKEHIFPSGLFALSPKEALLLQLKREEKENSIAYRMVDAHYSAVLKGNFTHIQKKLSCTLADIHHALRMDLAPLNLPPLVKNSSQYNNSSLKPDILLERTGQEPWLIRLADDEFFTLHLHSSALPSLTYCEKKEEKAFFQKFIREGIELIYAWEDRKKLLKQLASILIETFGGFFEGKAPLVPISLHSLASQLGVHHSTASRVIKEKYVQSPIGTLPLKSFFSSVKVNKNHQEVSAKELLNAIVYLVNSEDKSAPLSDLQLLKELKNKGFECSRRTVSKYRKKLNLYSSFQRKFT